MREIKPEIFIKSVTNGMLLNQQNIEKTVLSSLDLIEISLDGTGPKDNEVIRRNSNSGKVVKNIKALISARNNAGSNLRIAISSTQFYEGATKEISPPTWVKNEFGEDVDEYKVALAMRWPDMNERGNYTIEQMDGEDLNYWWMNANPAIWNYSEMKVDDARAYTTHNDRGNKRRIYKNSKLFRIQNSI